VRSEYGSSVSAVRVLIIVVRIGNVESRRSNRIARELLLRIRVHGFSHANHANVGAGLDSLAFAAVVSYAGLRRIAMLVEVAVIVEAKATHKLRYADKLQLMNYLAAMNLEFGLLLHFGPTAQLFVPRSDPENPTNPGFPPNGSSS
jgi:GxxExxY protein